MPWFGNPDSDSKGNSQPSQSSAQPWTPPAWSSPICGTTHLSVGLPFSSSTPQPAASHQISSGFYCLGTGCPSGERTDRGIHSSWRHLNVPSQHESPAALEPLPSSISTLPELTNAPPPDLDIEITSEEDNKDAFEPIPKKPMTDIAMTGPCTPAKIRARLPEDCLGKNKEATRWLLVMKACKGPGITQ